MFERFDEGARRVIFYARAEADAYGASRIETEHLLLAVLREDKTLCKDVLGAVEKIDAVRKQVGTQLATRQSPAKEIPLSNECKQALHFAVEDADERGLMTISTKQLFVAVLRIENSKALQLLKTLGADI
ncbi:MAG TPA: Clp protease N-terminal domain-containing protein [Candidatus Acidoferrales bacterium]|nr:Clp protease N-terminal domain-containing protein [Candidatus Acidoferrales bacterium]